MASRRDTPGRRPFYGWVIVAVSGTAAFGSVVFFNPVLGVFVSPLSQRFGWGRAEMSLAITIGSASAALVAPAVGWALDRWGSRWIIASASLVMGVCLLVLAGMTALWQLYVFYSLGRALSQGAINAGVFVTVSNWFVRRRSFAVALVSMGQRFGLAVVPVMVAVVIGGAGWRSGWMALSLVVLAVGVVPPLLMLRRRPEDSGLLPDGDRPPDPDDPAVPPAVEVEWSLRQAARTRSYWLVGISVGLVMFGAGSVNFHQIPHLEDRGLPPTQAALVVTVFSVFAAAGGLLGGAAATRLGVRRMLIVSLFGQAAGVLLLVAVGGVLSSMVYAVWYGLFFGSVVTLNQVVYADYFGRRSLGVIRGSFQPVQMAMNAAGPWLAGLWYDHAGSYDAVFTFFALLFLLAAASVALARYPHPPGGTTAADA